MRSNIVIIGNGFDLAHGYKSSYSAFITDLLKHKLLEALRNPRQACDDGFVSTWYNAALNGAEEFINNMSTIDEIFNNGHVKHNLPITGDRQEYSNRTGCFKFEIKSDLLQTLLIKMSDANWVDIESEYYSALLGCSDEFYIVKLNNELDYIKHKLIEYLIKINEVDFDEISSNKQNTKSFISGIIPKPADRTTTRNHRQFNVIINFNYTDHIKNYINGDYSIHNIHGSIKDPNSIVFGFGVSRIEEHKMLEKLNSYEAFRKIKRVHYNSSAAYRNIINTINLNEFQVVVIGHSCGISDSTVLGELFNSPNCKTISTAYVDDDDYYKKSIDIYKHMDDLQRFDRLIEKHQTFMFPKS